MRRVLRSPVTRAAILLALVALAVWELVRSWPRVRPDLERLDVGDLLLAVLLGIVPLLAGALSWRALLDGLGAALPPRAALTAFSIGQLGKYLPGSVWPVVMQGELAREHGVRRDRAVTASLLAMGMSLAAALVVAAVALPASGSLSAPADAGLAGLGVVVLAVLHPPVLTRLVNLALRLLRREPLPGPLSRRTVGRSLGWALVGALGLGAHAWVIARVFGPVPAGRAIGGFVLAWLAGFVVPLSPAGGGVRELVLGALFAGPLGSSGATALAAVSRVILTVIDLVGGLVAVAARPHRHPVREGDLGLPDPVH